MEFSGLVLSSYLIVSSSISNRLAVHFLQRDNLLLIGKEAHLFPGGCGSSIPLIFYVTFSDEHSKVVIVNLAATSQKLFGNDLNTLEEVSLIYDEPVGAYNFHPPA
jgi:hypothetical protein